MTGSRAWNNMGSGKRDASCINRSLMKYPYRSSENRMLPSRIGSLDGKKRGLGGDNGSSSSGAQSPPRFRNSSSKVGNDPIRREENAVLNAWTSSSFTQVGFGSIIVLLIIIVTSAGH